MQPLRRVPTIDDLKVCQPHPTDDAANVDRLDDQVKLCYICREEEQYDGTAFNLLRDTASTHIPRQPQEHPLARGHIHALAHS